MAEPFIGEIRYFAFGYPPVNWAVCDGAILSINQHQALYSILGPTFGGDGISTFALPDLRGRVPVHIGSNIAWGEKSGEQDHTLTISEMPGHNHQANGNSGTATDTIAAGKVWAGSALNLYTNASNCSMNPQALADSGASQSHNNMQPYLVGNYCIALIGIYPSRN